MGQVAEFIAPLRPPETVMRLARLGSLHQSRLSFMRILTRHMSRQNWHFEKRQFQIDDTGVGHAILTAHGPERSYSLVAFAHDLPDEMRSDRVIATAWDATFTLFDGIPSEDDIQRLSQNIPLQEAGRVTETELTVSRANRSVRLWGQVIEALAEGKQPDIASIQDVGYLMRTTAVYGSGKLGAADREVIAGRPEFSAPFQAEMLTVYLIRWFVIELVQHLANARAAAANRSAATLDPEIARALGVGNSTGLGMAPFLLNHPQLLNNWITAREHAIQAVRNIRRPSEAEQAQFKNLLLRNATIVQTWRSAHPIQQEKLAALTADIAKVSAHLSRMDWAADYPWNGLFEWSARTLSLEGQEWLASTMLEPYGHVIDGYAECMSDDSTHRGIDGAMTVGQLRSMLQDTYAWASALDWTENANIARAWYVSEEKLEPRLGERFEEPIADYEQPLAPGRDIAALAADCAECPSTMPIAEFLLAHPQHRYAAQRVQVVQRAPYAEIRDNTISSDVLPIDMLRCKLSFFGATKFDPRSDRWVRICMFGNAPLPYELTSQNADFWVYPQDVGATA